MTDVRPAPARLGIRDSVRFVRRFLKHPGKVGAVLPSSRYLAYAMVRDLRLSPGDLIVEYGPGTGPMTRAIEQLGLCDRGVHYLGIELDDNFHASLDQSFSDMTFHLGSVENVKSILSDHGFYEAKAIISGLPFASLPQTVQENVVQGTHDVLAEDGEFRTFQYVHSYRLPAARRFREMMNAKFDGYVRSFPVLRNVPPAYVLTYRKARAAP